MAENRKFVDSDKDLIPEITIECPVCKALPGNWCEKKGYGPGLHAARIDAYVWSRL